jgi:hypothetical protein
MGQNPQDDEPVDARVDSLYWYADAWGPTRTEVDEWALREHARRQKWLLGPGEEEKRTWARYERRRRMGEIGEAQLERSLREAALARLGVWSLLTLSPMEAWRRLIDAGREHEELFGRPRPRPRVRMDDEEPFP